MHLVLLAAAVGTLAAQPPTGPCRADQPHHAQAPAIAYRPPPNAPRKLIELPPGREVRAVRRMIGGCDYAEVRTSDGGWALKRDSELAPRSVEFPQGR